MSKIILTFAYEIKNKSNMCNFKCLLGMHHYEVLKEEDVHLYGCDTIVGKNIVSRCADCGKVKVTYIPLVRMSIYDR